MMLHWTQRVSFVPSFELFHFRHLGLCSICVIKVMIWIRFKVGYSCGMLHRTECHTWAALTFSLIEKRAHAWCRMLRSVESAFPWQCRLSLPGINEADAGCMWTDMLRRSRPCMWSPLDGAGSCRPIADKDTDSLITSRSNERCSSYGLSKFDGWHLITASPTGNFV